MFVSAVAADLACAMGEDWSTLTLERRDWWREVALVVVRRDEQLQAEAIAA